MAHTVYSTTLSNKQEKISYITQYTNAYKIIPQLNHKIQCGP